MESYLRLGFVLPLVRRYHHILDIDNSRIHKYSHQQRNMSILVMEVSWCFDDDGDRVKWIDGCRVMSFVDNSLLLRMGDNALKKDEIV